MGGVGAGRRLPEGDAGTTGVPRIGTTVWRRPLVASVLREKETWFIEHGQGRCPRSPVMASSVVAGGRRGVAAPARNQKKRLLAVQNVRANSSRKHLTTPLLERSGLNI